jgi:hypothetical protein
MARYISLDLARLIRDRAYTSGEIEKAARKAQALRSELAIVEAQHAQAKAELADIDARLKDYPSIKPARIRVIKGRPRRLKLTHGAFTREMVRYLREANGPVSTYELRIHLSEVFGIQEGTTLAEREWFRKKVARRLRHIADKGALQRLHNPDANDIGVWVWIGR